MRFGKPLPWTDKLLMCLNPAIIAAPIVYTLFKSLGHSNHGILFEITMIVFLFASALPIVVNLRRIRNRQAPLLEIDNQNLNYKDFWGTVKHYDLRNMKGRVESKGDYLKAPGLVGPNNPTLDASHPDDKIYIGCLEQGERQRFLEYLSNHAGAYEPAN